MPHTAFDIIFLIFVFLYDFRNMRFPAQGQGEFVVLQSAASHENLTLVFPTRSDTKGAVQPQSMAIGVIFWI